jgi:hypothetical protein
VRPGGKVIVEDWTSLGEKHDLGSFNRLFLGSDLSGLGAGNRAAASRRPCRADGPTPTILGRGRPTAVGDFWTLLRRLDKTRPSSAGEIFALEIGVGSGTRAGLWLESLPALSTKRGRTGYYPRLRFLLATTRCRLSTAR